ncbi:ATP-binding Cassette (ABC) superfamily, partial [Thraustotheca clavata]
MAISDGMYRTLVEVQEGVGTDGNTNSPSYFHRINQTLHDEPEMAELIRKFSSASGLSNDFGLSSDDDKSVASEVSLRRIMALTKPEQSYYIGGLVVCCLLGFSMPGIAVVISNVINAMQIHYNNYLATHDASNLDELYLAVRSESIIFIGVAIAIFFLSFAQKYCFRTIAEKLTTRVRLMHFQALLRQDIGFFDKDGHSTGALTTDLSTYATKVVVIAGETQGRLAQTVFTFIAAMIISFGFGSWQLTLLMLCVVPLMVFASMFQQHKMEDQKVSDSLTLSGALATEVIVNARAVQALGLQEKFADKYDGLLQVPLKEGIYEGQVNGVMNGFATFSIFIVYSLVFWYGAKLIHHDTITFDQMTRTLMAVMMAAQGMGQTAGWMGDADAAKKAAKQIFAIVDRHPTIDSSKVNDGIVPSSIEGRIEFKDVTFCYPTRPHIKVLKHYNLTIEPGQ